MCDRASTSSEKSKHGADDHEGRDASRNPDDPGNNGRPAIATDPGVGVVTRQRWPARVGGGGILEGVMDGPGSLGRTPRK